MQYTHLVAVTILVLSIERGNAISLSSIFGVGGDRTSDENDDSGTPTKISKVEEILKTLLLPIETVNGVKDIISKLPPPLRDPIKARISNGSRGFGDILNIFSDKFQAIYPGTLWCGAGDIAKNENDLGLFERTDACCRDHDNCFSNINAGEEKDGLLNNGVFTRSHCSCDRAFYDCLKNARSIVATKIGVTYFDVLNPQCFAEDYPNVDCSKQPSRTNDDKCMEYRQDYNEEKKPQWFDNPHF